MRRSLSVAEEKTELRRRGYAARRAANHRAEASRTACENVLGTPEYRKSDTVLWYLNIRTELQTQQTVRSELESTRTIVIPWVSGNDLRLWRLTGFGELESGAFGILEPRTARREDPTRDVDPADVDLVVVPGVGFDAWGNRIGNGHGHYDRFLSRVGGDTALIGLGFEAQRFDHVPHEPHDRAVHKVVTEAGIWTRGVLAKPVDIPAG
ncbi:MAG: 5-formyltetrahydrofolate cyclo-ligase [Pseudomonadota bacterium]|nr:5-formyltetrahydrofolate cyclo-ligase [Pseudomonadota bacterium]